MNKNILGFCIGMVFCTSLSLSAQQVSTTTYKNETRRGRIERTSEKGHDVVRFFNRDGKKTREVQLGETEVKARLGKNKRFNAATFGLKISTDVAAMLEDGAASGRDVEIKRRLSKSAELSRDKKYIVMQDSRADFMGYADARDGEYFNDAVDIHSVVTVSDLEGKEILNLDNYGDGVDISNTGEYFLITNEKNGAIINRKNEVLIELPVYYENAYFSDNDRFILLVERLSSSESAVSVFDTRENKLELRKLTVDPLSFQAVKTMIISEENREIQIQHIWDPKAQEMKRENFKF